MPAAAGSRAAWPGRRAIVVAGLSGERAMATSIPEVVSIKRYPNRRLYDRQARRYITLQDLEDLVLQGKKIEVRDSRTGEDLTRAILTQILLERHPEKMEMFPVAMLHGILQANDLVLDFLRSYLRQSLAILEQMQQPAPLAPFLASMDWMRAMMPTTLPFAPPRTGPGAAVPSSSSELYARLASLESRIRRLEQPTRRNPRRAAAAVAPTADEEPPEDETAVIDRLEERLTELESESLQADEESA
jgi:polyhydroxyalkanoate synthesis repressor PhaR